MEFRLLGPLEVHGGGHTIPIGGGRRRALLALLLLHRNEVIPAERLIDELWEGEPPASASKGLQVHISHLRKELGAADSDGALLTRPPGYVLQVDPDHIDVVRFERAVNDAARAREDGRPARAVADLREALAMWRGPPLVDFAYDAFARDEIARLEELHLLALEERVEAELALGRHREIVAEAEQLVANHASSERLRALLMVALYRSGRRAEALAVYRDGRARSVAELGIELGPELRALEQAVLTDDPSLAAPPHEPAAPSTRAALVLLVAAVLLAAAAGAAIVLEDRGGGEAPVASLDLRRDAVAALGVDGRPTSGVLLPGRPTDITAHGRQLYALSEDDPALTVLDGRTGRTLRTVELRLRPGAVGAGGEDAWVADRRRGLALRIDPVDGRVRARATWPRRRPAGGAAESRVAIAISGGSAWIADGSRTLVRAGASGRVRLSRLPHPADGAVAGAGAVWAFSRRRSAVMRLDLRTARVTDVVPLAGVGGAGAPHPTALAVAGSTVWVLSGNTATLSRIDARTRGVEATVRLGRGRSPRDLAAARGTVWIACLDGSVVRVSERGGPPRSSTTPGTLVGVAVADGRTWVAARGPAA